MNWQLAESGDKILDWYTALLELRKKHVTGSSRTCHAQLAERVLHLQIPAEGPTLRIVARFEDNAEVPEPAQGWSQALAHTEGENAVAVDLKSADVVRASGARERDRG